MAERCEVCGKKNDDRITIVLAGVGRFRACGECLNDYHNEEFDKLTKKLEDRLIKEDDKMQKARRAK